jgi:ADP-heptose:LPS heptosyltransferase/glycosyltransferase involved in cell wall biosynthesis
MKILIIKTGALGDVVRCTFIAQALKDKYKREKLEIYWLTSQLAKPMFNNNSYVAEVLVENKQSFSKLKKINFDLVINLEESKELSALVSELNTKKIQGFYMKNKKIIASETAKEWFDMSAVGPSPKNDILKIKNKKTHRQLMSEIIEVKDYKKYAPFIRLTQNQRTIANDFLRRHNLSRSDLIIGFNPSGGSGRWNKNLPIKKASWLIEKLYKKYNATIILLGGPNEIERNKEIIKITKAPIISAGCGNDLTEFPAIISVCSLVITTNSLALHLSLALKRKTIVMIGPTSPTEIGMYGLGKKVIANSKCVGCYKKSCKAIEKINEKQILNEVEGLIKQKVTLLITAFKEPKTIGKAIESALNQKTNYNYDVLVSAPDKETLDVVKKYQKNNKNLKIYQDPGKGKSFALNLIFKKIKTDILILTDGDVHLSDNSLDEIYNLFLDPEIGCLTGRPVPVESRETMLGYWANFLFESAHKLRRQAFENNNFLECSGYLFAFRKEIIKEIPLDVAEDSVIPYYFWEKGYKIGYAKDAKVFVKNAQNLKEWVQQKVRTSKAHETLEKYVDVKTTPRVKTFKTEAKGITWLLTYPKSFKEFFWSALLVGYRAWMWGVVFLDTKFKKKHYQDAWDRVESTK